MVIFGMFHVYCEQCLSPLQNDVTLGKMSMGLGKIPSSLLYKGRRTSKKSELYPLYTLRARPFIQDFGLRGCGRSTSLRSAPPLPWTVGTSPASSFIFSVVLTKRIEVTSRFFLNLPGRGGGIPVFSHFSDLKIL